MSVAVGFDAAFDPGQPPVGQQLSPSVQVETPLFLVDRQFERQNRHAITVLDPAGSVNLWFGSKSAHEHPMARQRLGVRQPPAAFAHG
jgi:hypothetical protein